MVKRLFSLEGSQGTPVSRVRLSALTFKHAAPTYMDEYAVGSGGDYSLYQGGVVHIASLFKADFCSAWKSAVFAMVFWAT